MSSIIKRPAMVLLVLFLSAPIFASVNGPFFALNTKFEGNFSKAKSIYFFNYTSGEACLDDNGT